MDTLVRKTSGEDPVIQCPPSPGRYELDFDPAHHVALRRQDCPVVGHPIGTLPSNPQQSGQLGPPFVYTAEQLQVVRGERGGSSAVVLEDLGRRGYFVTCGLKYGFDFVAYEGDPVRHHGSYYVLVVDASLPIKPRELVTWNRLAATAHKSIILATVDELAPHYVLLSSDRPQ